jgi:16S rRNA (cytidine1402-2'-O)-methyltransferase
LAGIRATLVFYESGPRLAASLAALAEGLGPRDAAVAREISKTFEETITAPLTDLVTRYSDAPPKGEMVIVVAPPGEAEAASEDEVDAALGEALKRLPPAKAAGEVAKALGADRKVLYARAMVLKERE